jgi:DNA polymerase-4
VLLTSIPPHILHLDGDAFFASLEQRDAPRLRGRPVAVGTGVVASCSYEARRFGVRTGMRLFEARARCRPLCVIPGDYRRYEQAARQVLGICLEQTTQVESAALDDLYLDLTPQVRHADEPGALAERIAVELRRRILEEVRVSFSAGLGTGKFPASAATDHAKQRGVGARAPEGTFKEPHPGVVRVLPGHEARYLAPWPAELLPGVGPQTAARLARLNVRTVGAVAALPVAVLCGLFGQRGRKLRDLARGSDPRPVQPARPSQSVSRCTSFDPPASDFPFLLAMLDHLLERAASWLRFHGLATRGLTVSLRYGDYRSEDGRTPFPEPINSEQPLREAARERFGRLYTRRLPLRLLGVELSPLEQPAQQLELFADPAAERARRLEACKDAVRQRFGFLALVHGSALVLAERLEHDRDNFRLRTPCLTR